MELNHKNICHCVEPIKPLIAWDAFQCVTCGQWAWVTLSVSSLNEQNFEKKDPANDGPEVNIIKRERELAAEQKFLDAKPARKHFHFPVSD